ncbi:MAG: 16S rRNA (guanine(966)-N(2))-methyltransferase RsmD [bacterium]|nr:16S rRNA (guanine(966)-N(2))-methyltransferase RsmD [bacterium]
MRSNGSSGRKGSGTLRIIGGFARGRRLKAPRGLTTRPMTDRVREALFSTIAAVLPGADVLDLYAGTGSLGLEALSRGASSAVFVERNPAALRVLRANVEAVGLGGGVVAMEVGRFLSRKVTRMKSCGLNRFDLVFVDPPYSEAVDSVKATMEKLEPVTRIGGTVIVHRRAGDEQPQTTGFERERTHTYGTTRIWRFRRIPICQA